MVGTSAGTAMVLAIVLLGSLLGIAAGGLSALALRQPWSSKVAVRDAVLAAIVVVIAAYVIVSLDIARGILESRVALVLSIAAACVVLRHLLRLR